MTESLHQQATDDGTLQPLVSGMLAGSRIRTLEGTLPVEYLEPGDRIVTRAGARQLVGVSVQVLEDADMIRIRASTLGHDRPDHDLLVLPDQPIVIRDWRARALYSAAMAAIPAAQLVDGEFIRRETLRTARLYALQFDKDEVVYAEGLEVACPAQLPATVSG
jgi:Hint domain